MIENDLIRKECERLQKARFDRKLKEYQISRGIYKPKAFNSVDEIMKEDDYQPIVFYLEKSVFKDTFDTAHFKEKNQILSPTRKKNDEEKKKKEIKPVLSLEVNITRTKKEKLEIFAEDDPYLVAEEFSKKFSKFIN